MKKTLFTAMMMAVAISMNAQGGPGGDSGGGGTPGGGGTSADAPDGAYYTLSDGTTVTKTGEEMTTSTSDYNVVQVSNGTLTLSGCTITKTGDTSRTDGDATSFYGTNSAIYAGVGTGNSSSAGSTSSATGAVINIKDCTVTTTAKGSNAVFCSNGATINVEGITIVNNTAISRGLHCTYGGTIVASDVDITTNSETSSTIATDRGGGTVTVNGGTATANGAKSAVIYSTGTMSATDLVGTSAQGEIAVIDGDNSISMTNCTMTSGSSERGLLMMQSGSGDASGVNPEMTITGTSLTMTNSSAPLLEVATCVTATCMLSGCAVTVPSGILMYVMADSQWSTSGAVGNLILDNGTYNGIVKYDTGYTANVTVNSGAVWNLTADTSIGTLVNNGTINTNGYTLTTTSTSGSGTINTSATAVIIGSMGWNTLYTPVALDFSTVSGLTAYTATFGSSTATLTEVTAVPAGTALVLKGTANTTYTIPTAASASAVSNDLSGTSTGLVTTSSNSYYALGKIDDSTVGFIKVDTGVGIPGGKAYYSTSTSNARAYYSFDNATGLSAPAILQQDDSPVYDLNGRRISSPSKGIYLKNGKKYVK